MQSKAVTRRAQQIGERVERQRLTRRPQPHAVALRPLRPRLSDDPPARWFSEVGRRLRSVPRRPDNSATPSASASLPPAGNRRSAQSAVAFSGSVTPFESRAVCESPATSSKQPPRTVIVTARHRDASRRRGQCGEPGPQRTGLQFHIQYHLRLHRTLRKSIVSSNRKTPTVAGSKTDRQHPVKMNRCRPERTLRRKEKTEAARL